MRLAKYVELNDRVSAHGFVIAKPGSAAICPKSKSVSDGNQSVGQRRSAQR